MKIELVSNLALSSPNIVLPVVQRIGFANTWIWKSFGFIWKFENADFEQGLNKIWQYYRMMELSQTKLGKLSI